MLVESANFFTKQLQTTVLSFTSRLIPESPRWLLLHNKENEARNQLLKIAKMNKKTLPDDDIKKPVISEHRASLRQLFLSWKVTKITLISWNLW